MKETMKQRYKLILAVSIAILIGGALVANVIEAVGSIIIIIGIIGIIISLKVGSPSKDEQEAERLKNNVVVIAVNGIANDELKIIENPTLIRKDEVTHLMCHAIRYVTRNQVVGHEASLLGASFRVARGVSIRGGGIKGGSIKEDVTTTYGGTFVLTNKRIIFLNEQKGFESTIDTLGTIRSTEDGKVIITKGSESLILHLIIEQNKKDKITIVNNSAGVLIKAIQLIRQSE